MSEALFEFGGLRFWNQEEIKTRNRIVDQITDCVMTNLKSVNQGWFFEQVDTPVIMPKSLMNESYTEDDVFILKATMGDDEMALRAETTLGSYLMAKHILSTTRTNPPIGVWQYGQSFRRELSDGATAAKMRFNSFYQLEFQLIFGADTHFDYGEFLRLKLVDLVSKITGKETRLITSDRLPKYSTETIDIEVKTDTGEWREVASTSRRIDLLSIPSQKKELKVFEIAFGADRMCLLS